MKKTLKFLALLLAGIFVISGCSKSKPETEIEPEPDVDPVALEIEEFFDKYVDTKERPIAVMIDNDDHNARPQAGLSDAYLIYELVVEGGATRFMALFKGADTERIGPVRSSRHYFLDYVMENDAIYTHYGWSPKAIQDISAFNINKINGVLGSDGSVFWKEEKYKGDWHCTYTSMDKIKTMAAQKGFETETEHQSGIKYSDTYIDLSSENAAKEVSLAYSPMYTTGYHFNEEKGVYEKTINNSNHVMQSGEVLEFKNIIIELIADTELGDGTARRNLNTVGTGEGYYITNGAYEKITWSKSSRSGNTVYTKADGTELLLNPGKTIVNVISPYKNISIN